MNINRREFLIGCVTTAVTIPLISTIANAEIIPNEYPIYQLKTNGGLTFNNWEDTSTEEHKEKGFKQISFVVKGKEELEKQPEWCKSSFLILSEWHLYHNGVLIRSVKDDSNTYPIHTIILDETRELTLNFVLDPTVHYKELLQPDYVRYV